MVVPHCIRCSMEGSSSVMEQVLVRALRWDQQKTATAPRPGTVTRPPASNHRQ